MNVIKNKMWSVKLCFNIIINGRYYNVSSIYRCKINVINVINYPTTYKYIL